MSAFIQAILGAAALALTLSHLGPVVLDGGPTYSSYGPTPGPSTPAAQDTQLAACQALHGPNAVALAMPNGDHRCADKRGRPLPRTRITTLHPAGDKR